MGSPNVSHSSHSLRDMGSFIHRACIRCVPFCRSWSALRASTHSATSTSNCCAPPLPPEVTWPDAAISSRRPPWRSPSWWSRASACAPPPRWRRRAPAPTGLLARRCPSPSIFQASHGSSTASACSPSSPYFRPPSYRSVAPLLLQILQRFSVATKCAVQARSQDCEFGGSLSVGHYFEYNYTAIAC